MSGPFPLLVLLAVFSACLAPAHLEGVSDLRVKPSSNWFGGTVPAGGGLLSHSFSLANATFERIEFQLDFESVPDGMPHWILFSFAPLANAHSQNVFRWDYGYLDKIPKLPTRGNFTGSAPATVDGRYSFAFASDVAVHANFTFHFRASAAAHRSAVEPASINITRVAPGALAEGPASSTQGEIPHLRAGSQGFFFYHHGDVPAAAIYVRYKVVFPDGTVNSPGTSPGFSLPLIPRWQRGEPLVSSWGWIPLPGLFSLCQPEGKLGYEIAEVDPTGELGAVYFEGADPFASTKAREPRLGKPCI